MQQQRIDPTRRSCYVIVVGVSCAISLTSLSAGGCNGLLGSDQVIQRHEDYVLVVRQTCVQIPMSLSGEPWDFEPLSKAELAEFLAKKLPDSDQVSPDANETAVFEKWTVKSVVVIPEESRKRLRQDKYRDYLREGAGDGPWPGQTVGEYLQGLIETMTPEGEPFDWFGEYSPEAEGRGTMYGYVVLVTKRNVLIIRVPKDNLYKGIY